MRISPRPSAPEPDPARRQPELRASDADREAVAERLRDAAAEGRIDLEELQERLDQVFAAKTYGELEPVTADLPADPAAVAGRALQAARQAAAQQPLLIKGGMHGTSRVGHWVVPDRIEVYGGMGSVKLDFTRAEVPHQVVDISVRGDMGGVVVVVPEGWPVDTTALNPGLGGVKNKAVGAPVAGAPLLRVAGSGGMGGVVIRYPNRWERRRLRDKRAG
ncbi:DUF1707 domain-containing protein [Streptomyces sp. YIM 98790]|uniref:DUF1707 SHOCT-like domain-containing protein n=1 Tax=Streptomyces sp. YIM 98790 TaxID=2689077 RepID=UPI00140AACC7|nr:DUF1707 domain-containing protein [Streptomyces sp. YIM 98790]